MDGIGNQLNCNIGAEDENRRYMFSHLHLWQILGITYIWCKNAGRSRGLPIDMRMEELDI